jgi:hypothetical protein
MADPRAFISFDFDHDETSRMLFAGQGKKESPTPYTVGDWSSKSVLPQKEWKELIQAKINVCNLVIVLVGKFMASATGVAAEISMARDCDVPSFGVYVNGANTSSNLPAGLPRSRTYAWTWANVGAAIDMCMKEGKNAR